jgi:hypothetical protein
MSNSEPHRAHKPDEADEPDSTGPNLTLIYSLLGLALIAAIVIAAFIVLPFYQRR